MHFLRWHASTHEIIAVSHRLERDVWIGRVTADYAGEYERTFQLVDDGAALARRRGLSADFDSGFEAFLADVAACKIQGGISKGVFRVLEVYRVE